MYHMTANNLKKLFLICIMTFLSCAFSLSQTVTGTPDYSSLEGSAHPRLIYDSSEFSSLKKLIRSRDNEVVLKLHRHAISVADAALADSSVLRFKKDASDKRILHISSRAVKRLVPCAYAYRMTGHRGYLRKVEKDLLSVCSFPSWNHSHFLDVAEMAAGVSIAYDWLYDDLRSNVRAEVERALRDFALIPSRSEDRKYTWWYTTKNNWNSICNAGLVCAAITIYDTCPDIARAVIDDALKYNPKAVSYMYSPDGAYPEGASYWSYGTIYQVLLNTVLEAAFGTDFGLSSIPGFLKSARFQVFSRGNTGKSFNFADSGSKISRTNVPLWYFAAKSGDSSLLYDELTWLDSPSYAKDGYVGYLPVAIRHAIDLEIGHDSLSAPKERLYSAQGHIPVMMCRTGWGRDDHYLGIKGGRDGYNHGHMDGGTFVYDAYGVRWAMDFDRQAYAPLEKGLKPYGKRLIDPAQDSWRWKIFRLNCRQHNTLTVNDKNHDVKAHVAMTSVEDSDSLMAATFDLTPLFWGDLAKAERTAGIRNGEYLEIRDVLASPSDRPAHVRWTMVTEGKPEIVDGGIILRKKGKKMLLKAEGADVTYRIWSSDPQDYDSPIKHLDYPNPDTYICGYEIDIPAATQYTVIVTLVRN